MNKGEYLLYLQTQGVVEELCPSPSHWTFKVLKPEELPPDLKLEYQKTGQLCWNGAI